MDTDHLPLLREAAASADLQGAADLRWEDHLWEDLQWADLLRSAEDTDHPHHLLRHLRREDGAAVFRCCLFLSEYLRQGRSSASNVKVTAVSLT